jgi:hypothetical protein
MFSVLDHQTGRYLSTGLNSGTLEQCVEDWKGYYTCYSMDDDDEETNNRIRAYDQDKAINFASAVGFEFVEHEEPFEED